MVTKTIAPTDDLAGMAASVDNGPPTAEQEEQLEQEQQQQAEANAAMAHMGRVVEKMALGLFRALRTKIARDMPEILEEWPDALLEGPAEALPPVVQRYVGFLFKVIDKAPELGVFLFSLLPLVQGYFAAADRQAKRTVDEPRPAS